MITTGGSVAPGRLGPKEERSRDGVNPRRGRWKGKEAVLEEGASDVYRDMLRDVVDTSVNRPEELSDSDESRPFKKHKAMVDSSIEVGSSSGGDKGKGILIEDSDDDTGEAIENGDNENNVGPEEESEESSDESEADWEEVDLRKQCLSSRITTSLHVLLISSLATMNFVAEPPKEQPLELVLDHKEKPKTGHVRRVITSIDRRIRLEVHKMHLLCLLIHVYQRSRWCNDSNVKVVYPLTILN